MIPYEEALERVLAASGLRGTETVPLAEGLGRVLASEVRAPEPVPLFDSSAMDGYAVRARDTEGASAARPVELPLQGEQRAGGDAPPALAPGRAMRIFTGALVPEGADAVVIVEHTEERAGRVRLKAAARPGDNIRRTGEEFPEGGLVFPPRTRITPPVSGTLASLGVLSVEVVRRPEVSLVITGDEVLPPGEKPGPGQVRDAHGFSLPAALAAMGLRARAVLHAPDEEGALEQCLRRAMEGADVVITTGGVSMGRYDLVRGVLERLGVEELFWKVAVKPGKPNYLGRRGAALFFGLPGNTVSVLVSFLAFVRPALFRMEGRGDPFAGRCRAVLRVPLKKKPGRLEFVRARLFRREGAPPEVEPVRGRHSHMLGNMALADCLIHFPPGRERLEAGEAVTVDPLKWSDL